METEDLNNDSPPELIIFSGKGEEWQAYEEQLFKIFHDTIATGSLSFQGLPVSPRRHPEYKGRHFTFWHLISEGPTEDERTPDFRRCERIAWVAWTISNAIKNPGISYWESKRPGSTNVVLWYEEGQFAVILAKRKKYFVLLSAYQIVDERRIKSFERERDDYRANIS